jgi:hypothetical protein
MANLAFRGLNDIFDLRNRLARGNYSSGQRLALKSLEVADWAVKTRPMIFSTMRAFVTTKEWVT